jgi:hypothetical protein
MTSKSSEESQINTRISNNDYGMEVFIVRHLTENFALPR